MMAPCRGDSIHHPAMSRRGATAAAPSPLLLSFGVLVLALTPDPTASFAGGGPNPPAAHRQRYRRPTAPYSGRRRSTLIPAAGPSTPSPSPSPKRPAAAVAKKKGVGSVKFGGRVSRPLQGDGPDSKGEEEEDVRKSARWGAKPPSPPEIKIPKVLDVGAFKNPLDGVGKSLRKVCAQYLRENVSQRRMLRVSFAAAASGGGGGGGGGSCVMVANASTLSSDQKNGVLIVAKSPVLTQPGGHVQQYIHMVAE